MGWHETINKEIIIDGDEGTIYLPSEVFEYMSEHKFSVICAKRTNYSLKTISCYSKDFQVNETKYGATHV